MNNLIVVIMGPGKKHFAEMCLESIKNADKILYFTSDKENEEWDFIEDENIEVYYNQWDENDKATNAKARNLYLGLLKEEYPDDWALILDEDELLEEDGIKKLKRFIRNSEPGLYNVKMRHFIGDLGHEDATRPVHVVPCRLFKISEAKSYPLHSHPVLEGELKGGCLDTTIWHLGHLPMEYMDYIFKRYKQHLNDSVIHTHQFLNQWKISHLMGMYPKRQINPLELPNILCKRYEIDKDVFYFSNRGIESKHFIMVHQWKQYFKNAEVLDCGCGIGPYMYVWDMYGTRAYGFDKSEYAVKNNLAKESEVWIGDLLLNGTNRTWQLVTAIDILEHIKYEDLDLALENLSQLTEKQILFSIPYEGDPNLDADPTHIIKESKEWWIEQLSKYFEIKDAPKDWLFADQLLIGKKK